MYKWLIIFVNLMAMPAVASSDPRDPVELAILAFGFEQEMAAAYIASGGEVEMSNHEYSIRKLVIESDKIAKKTPNVHAYNKTFARAHYAELLGYYSEFSEFPPVLDWDGVQALVREYDSSPNVNNALTKMTANIKAHGVADPESMVDDIVALLNLDWHLASQFGLEYMVVQSLRENQETGGGCHPGYAGRFVRDLLTLMVMILDIQRGQSF